MSEEDRRQMSGGGACDAATALWVATAALHRRDGNSKQFTRREISNMVDDLCICKAQGGTILDYISTRCSASSEAESAEYCMLLKDDGAELHRLCCEGDKVASGRGGDCRVPEPMKIPTEWRKDLLEWYNIDYCGKGRPRAPCRTDGTH